MKLTYEYFFPVVTNEGAKELYAFTKAIMCKSAQKIPHEQWEDLQQEMILRCLEKLPKFDSSKCVLGGFLYWQARGAISIHANKFRKEIPSDSPLLEHIRERQVN